MNQELPYIQWDCCHTAQGLGCRTLSDPVAGTFWLIVLREQTLKVEPYQTKSNPAPTIEGIGIPRRIDSAFAGSYCQGDFAQAVNSAMTIGVISKEEAIEELRMVLERHGVHKQGDEWLELLVQFISPKLTRELRNKKDEECSPEEEYLRIVEPSLNHDKGACTNANLCHVVGRVKDLTGEDISESLIRSFLPDTGWTAYLESWIRDAANDFPFGEVEARKHFIKKVRWIAEFAGGKMWPVCSVETVHHDREDVDLIEKMQRLSEVKQNENASITLQNEDDIIDQGKRFVILNDYRCLFDKEMETLYSFGEDSTARKALRAFHEHAKFPNWEKAGDIKFHMSGNHDSKPKEWFSHRITPNRDGMNFMHEAFPLLIQHKPKEQRWCLSLDGEILGEVLPQDRGETPP